MSERASFRGGGPSSRGGSGGGRGSNRGSDGHSHGRGSGGRGGRGGRGGGGGAHHHGHQGGAGVGGAGGASGSSGEKPKKENILDLTKYLDKEIRVKFSGGREAIGTLKGYDQLMNLVLDDVKEIMRDDEGNESSRLLGLLVARGTLLVLISPLDGSQEIANPFLPQDDDEGATLPQ